MLRGALLRAARAASARRLPAVLGRSVTTRATGPASACTLSRQLAQPHGTTTLWRFSAVRAFSSDAVVEVPVPALGDSIAEGTVAGILKDVGEWVDMDEVVLTLETDKVSFDVRAPEAGYVEELLIEDGDTVPVGAVLLKLKKGDPPAGAEKKAEAPKAADDSSSSSSSAAAEAPPAAKEAPKAAAPKAATPPPPPPPAPVTAGSRTEERVKMSPMRKRIAERLKDSQNTAAMLTTFQEVDMGTLIDLRKRYKEDFAEKHGVKLGFMSAFIKASAAALMEIPAVNAVIDGTDIVYRNYVDVSVAVASPRGLVVPVIRNVQDMNFAGIELTLGELAHKARTGSIALEDMAGGTFTISNGGVFGSLMGTPILNLPQSAILGMHATKPRPVVVNGEVVIRPMMYLALTYDHRLIDGREAVTFLCSVRDKLAKRANLAKFGGAETESRTH